MNFIDDIPQSNGKKKKLNLIAVGKVEQINTFHGLISPIHGKNNGGQVY